MFDISKIKIQGLLSSQPNNKSISNDIEKFDSNIQLLPKINESRIKWVIVSVNKFFANNKYDIINKLISICLHIFIMSVFEIYFYFNYVVIIEKTEFMDKINSYFNNFDYMHLTKPQTLIIKNIIESNQLGTYLYDQYINSLKNNNKYSHNY